MPASNNAQALAEQPLDDLATSVQRLASRLRALLLATDDLLDFTLEQAAEREAFDSALNLLQMAREAVAQLQAYGEAVEIVAMARKREAA